MQRGRDRERKLEREWQRVYVRCRRFMAVLVVVQVNVVTNFHEANKEQRQPSFFQYFLFDELPLDLLVFLLTPSHTNIISIVLCTIDVFTCAHKHYDICFKLISIVTVLIEFLLVFYSNSKNSFKWNCRNTTSKTGFCRIMYCIYTVFRIVFSNIMIIILYAVIEITLYSLRSI